jgi:cardiolipin synthase
LRSFLVILPTSITLARLCAVPITVWLILVGRYDAALWLFIIAGASDALDGALARMLDARSTLGAYLDPIADKALLVSVFLALASMQAAPIWLAILIVFRDLLIVGGVLLDFALGTTVEMAPLRISKVNTAAQIILAAWLLAESAMFFQDPGIAEILIWVTAATTFASGGVYLADWLRRHLSPGKV